MKILCEKLAIESSYYVYNTVDVTTAYDDLILINDNLSANVVQS